MASSGIVSIPRCPVIFDGINFGDFVSHMRIHMRGLRLWGYLSGDFPCPPRPVCPTEPLPVSLPSDAAKTEVDAAKTAYDEAVTAYQDCFGHLPGSACCPCSVV